MLICVKVGNNDGFSEVKYRLMFERHYVVAGKVYMTLKWLASGAPTLTKPLVQIFNKSISESTFPEAWKEAIVTPVLEKGDKTEKENYRPVQMVKSLIALAIFFLARSWVANKQKKCYNIPFLHS